MNKKKLQCSMTYLHTLLCVAQVLDLEDLQVAREHHAWYG